MSPAPAAVNATGIAYTRCPVRDLRRARTFYENRLGLVATATVERAGRGWIEYQIGAGRLVITNRPQDGRPSSRGALVALQVGSVDGAAALLSRAGDVVVAEPVRLTSFRFVLTADPDGNRVMLYERIAGDRHGSRCVLSSTP